MLLPSIQIRRRAVLFFLLLHHLGVNLGGFSTDIVDVDVDGSTEPSIDGIGVGA
jgi:hypothetical protein